MKKRVITGSMVMMTLMLSACSGKVDEFSKEDNSLNFEVATRAVTNEKEATSDVSEVRKTPIYKTYVSSENIYDQSLAINENDIEYSNLSVEVMSNLPEYIKASDMFGKSVEDYTDTTGKLLDGYVYVSVNLSINNLSDKTKTIYLNSYRFAVLDTDGNAIDSVKTDSEIYRNDYTGTDEYKKDYFKLELEPQQQENVNIIYIAPESVITSDALHYIINMSHGAGYKYFKAFRITQIKGLDKN